MEVDLNKLIDTNEVENKKRTKYSKPNFEKVTK
jgi:hypothetical protein